MKTPYVVILGLALAAGPIALAADEKPKPEDKPKAEAAALEAAETPEAAIEQIEEVINSDDSESAGSPEEANAFWEKRLVEVDKLLADFRKRFAAHPLRWK